MLIITWWEEKRNRLTASNFGAICKRRSSSSVTNLLKQIYYKNLYLDTPAIRYGKDNLHKAKNKFTKNTGINIINCGIFIDEELKFFGARPDGVVCDNKGLIEIKCLFSIKNKLIKESIKNNN